MRTALAQVTVGVVCLASVLVLPSCRKNGATVRVEAPNQTHAPQPTTKAPVAAPAEPSASTEPVEDVVFDTSSQWLRAEKLPADVPGGWVTGDFLPQRNKIELHTHDVTQFSIDVSKLPIDWERLVVLGIDGRNSELRKRDFNVYHIARDEKGNWVVLEP